MGFLAAADRDAVTELPGSVSRADGWRNNYPSNRSTAMPAPMIATVCKSIA